jgi:hypothetical protein
MAGDPAALDEAALLLFEGHEIVADLKQHETAIGSWCCQFRFRKPLLVSTVVRIRVRLDDAIHFGSGFVVVQ